MLRRFVGILAAAAAEVSAAINPPSSTPLITGIYPNI